MIGVVCHDAGGAEVVSSWLINQPESFIITVKGPAIKIFEKKIQNFINYPLSTTINQCNWLLCGTSWESNIEKEAILLAKLHSKKTVAYLDHWVNYRERFILNSKINLPNEIWVGDQEAFLIAKRIFISSKVVLAENKYLENINSEIEAVKTKENHEKIILYLCEPIAKHIMENTNSSINLGYDENTALNYFLNNIDFIIDNKSDYKIIIRPHPSEPRDKYDWVLLLNDKIEISKCSLNEDIAISNIVIGCETVALVVALFASKRVICAIPPGGIPCRLPFNNIETLQQIVLEKQNV